LLDGITCHHVNCEAVQAALDAGSEMEKVSLKQVMISDDTTLITPYDEDEGI